MNYTLQGPEGATLSGGTLSWMPTQQQSRITNDFTVTSTTTAGGVAMQSWSVVPNGSIQISAIDNYWSVNEEGVLQANSEPE